MTTHIMVDLETWGLTPGSDIRSIGAVVFDPVAGTLGDEFYNNAIGGELFGLMHDPDTVDWWSRQSAAAQQRLFVDQKPVRVALYGFKGWWEAHGGAEATFWAHGPHFDEAILGAVYRATGVPIPWSYRAPRDCRTIFEAAGGVEVPFEGTEHNALDDAKHQARCVIEAYRRLKLSRDLDIPFHLWPDLINDDPVQHALKKAARQIRQMDKDKAWISNDVRETLAAIDLALGDPA